MKNWITGIFILLIIAAAMYCFAYFLIIPGVAKAMIPGKWESVVLNEKKNNFINYLGKPVNSETDKDIWLVRKNSYQYTLTVEYNHADSLSKKYVISYDVKSWLFRKKDILKADSTRQTVYTDSL